MRLTELEKTILIAFYTLSGGSTRRYVAKETLLKKFPMRNRKTVRKYVDELEKKKLIIKHAKTESYRLNKKAVKQVVSFILTGATIRVS